MTTSAQKSPELDPDTLLMMVGLAKRVLDHFIKEQRPMPPEVRLALSAFYDLTDYHSVAPADAPHIPDTGI